MKGDNTLKKFSKILCLILSVMMIMSILPLSVAAACSHSYTKVYTMENANMHSYVSKCTKCGTITEGYGYSGWLDHTFNSYGKCTACGYCKHSSTKTVYSYENGNMHSYYAKCNGCGQKLEGYGYSGWSNHSFSGNICSQCGYTKSCSHSSTSTKYSNLSSSQHKYWTHCNSCGIDYNYVTTSHSWSNGSWSSISDSQHKRSKSCVCGASSSETGSHNFSGNSCTSCGYTKVSTPVVNATVSLSASGPSGTLGSAGGEIASEKYPASYTVSASASGCSVTKIVYTLNGRTYTVNGSSVTITANSQNDFYTSTFTAYTSVSGVTATFTVNFKYVRKASSQVMWETSQEAVIRSITGNGLNKSLSYSMTIPNSYDSQGNLTASQIATIQSLIGRNDGKTYTVNYTRTIWVYTPAEYSSSGQKEILGTFDGNSSSDMTTCLTRWGWSTNTKSAIQQAASSSLTFTTGLSTDCTAIWIDTSTNKQLYTKTFGSGTVSASSSKVVSVSYSEYSGSGNYVYEKLTYSGDTSGTSTSQSYSQTYTVNSKPLTVTFYCHPKEAEVTTGTITVYVRDAETNALLSGATVSGAGKSGTTGSAGYVKFASIALGTYTFTASKSGYNSNSGSVSISKSTTSNSVTIYLTPIPTSGTITVYVKDASTGGAISGASVSGGGVSGSTNTSGYVSFSGLSFGSYTFSASKSGYSSNSGSASISTSATTNSVTIYLNSLPTTGDITVKVVDSETGSVISGASVSGASRSGSTNSSGYAYFYDVPFGSYTFTASKSGYYSDSSNAVISLSDMTDSITIYLDPIPTTGDITVKVVDSETRSVISGASVSGASRSGTTNSSGYAYFYDVPFGSYTFTASKSGYYSDSSTAVISLSDMTDNITIYLDPIPTTGDITVKVVDSETGSVISGASVSGASRSGSTNSSGYAYFYDVPFGSYTFTASKSGYYSDSSTAVISLSDMTDSITIYLDPIPTEGDITVKVVDSGTGKVISGASVSGASRSGTTNSSGYAYFNDVPFGSYTFTASKTGYYSNTGTATISLSDMTKTITIYLDLIPTSGDITVYVKDKETGSAISGASVSGGGRSGTTNSSGYIKFTELDFGSYTFTASADGYVSGSGSTSISVTATDKTITIYLEEKKTDLSPDAIINGDIYKGSTIIVSAEINNDGDIDLIPGKAATVTMTAKRNGGSVFDTQTTTVIIPANDSNLVWFTVNMPASGYTSNTVTFEFKVTAPSGVKETTVSNNTDTISKTVVDLPNRNCADPGLELDAPSGLNYSKYSSNSATTRTWSVYEWNGGFVKKTYTAKLVMSASLVPDASAGYRKQSGGIWTTRSGYGLNTEVTVSVSGTTTTAGTLKVDTFYPEHNYSTATNKSDRLELVSGKYVFKSNGSTVSGSRMHTTPLWFPDKAYAVKYYAYDLWCPGGMLYGYTNAYVNIDGDMYDDLYTN